MGAECIVVSVGYRLASPLVNKCPTAPEDGYRALCWVALHAADYALDLQRLSIGGASSGGNIAAVIALIARNRGGPGLCFQLLELPATDFRVDETVHPSISQFAEGYYLTRRALDFIKSVYLASPQQASSWLASPLLAPDLTGLPTTLIMTAEYDPLRDEGEAFGRRLKEAVSVDVVRWDGSSLVLVPVLLGSEHLNWSLGSNRVKVRLEFRFSVDAIPLQKLLPEGKAFLPFLQETLGRYPSDNLSEPTVVKYGPYGQMGWANFHHHLQKQIEKYFPSGNRLFRKL